MNFGIDFGTTNTAVMCIEETYNGVEKKVLGENGSFPFSSIVAIPKNSNDTLLFGTEVKKKRNELSENYEIITSIKSYLGTDREFIIGNQRYTATDITANFLKHVKTQIKLNHNKDMTEATFSFPIDFTPMARKELKKAAIQAGITPKGFIGESTAAFVSNTDETKTLSKVMVVDWGGGTLDLSILEITADKVVELSVWGDKVGGDDIDNEMARRIHTEITANADKKIKFEDMPAKDKDTLLAQCEFAKIEFSDFDEDFFLTVRNYGNYGTKNVTLTYAFFNDVVKSIILKKVLPTIENALSRADLSKSDIDGVIIVGGSSNIRPFATAMSNLFGTEKLIIPNKIDWAVAEGACLIDINGIDIKLNENLGILMSDNTSHTILPKETHGVGSDEVVTTFSLVEDSSEAHFIFVNEQSVPYARVSVPCKGFNKEDIIVSASVTDEQVANIKINNPSMGDNSQIEIEINKLTFYYNLK